LPRAWPVSLISSAVRVPGRGRAGGPRQRGRPRPGRRRVPRRAGPHLRAALFYGVNVAVALTAAIILIPGAPLLAIALNANVLATVLLPVTLVFLIMLASDRQAYGIDTSCKPPTPSAEVR